MPRVIAARRVGRRWPRGLEQRLRALDAFVARRLRPAADRRRGRASRARVLGGAELLRADAHAPAPAGAAAGSAIAGFDVVRGGGRRARRCSRTTCARPAASPTRWPRGRRSWPRSRARLDGVAPPVDGARRRCCVDALAAPRCPRPRRTPPTRARAAHRRPREQRVLGARAGWRDALGIPLVEPGRAARARRPGLLRAELRPVDVVYRRTNEDRRATRAARPAARSPACGAADAGRGERLRHRRGRRQARRTPTSRT